jgi:hypothetical protein
LNAGASSTLGVATRLAPRSPLGRDAPVLQLQRRRPELCSPTFDADVYLNANVYRCK